MRLFCGSSLNEIVLGSFGYIEGSVGNFLLVNYGRIYNLILYFIIVKKGFEIVFQTTSPNTDIFFLMSSFRLAVQTSYTIESKHL